MKTEQGTVKTGVKHDEKLLSELNKNLRVLSILYMILGGLITVFGILAYVVDVTEGETDSYDLFIIFLGVVFVCLGVFFYLYYKNFNKSAYKMNRVEELEFFNDHIIEREYTDGELTSLNKVYYKWIVKIRETKNYIFLYNTRVTAMAVDKNSLPPDELNTVRGLIGRPQKTAPAQNVQNSGSTEEKSAPPAEPFADIAENDDNKEE